MQTFLPSWNFYRVAELLDKKRLFKQLVESRQILNALEGRSKGWRNHPAVKMWRGCEQWLRDYSNCMLFEVRRRGIKTKYKKLGCSVMWNALLPLWFRCDRLRHSHQAALVYKDPAHYGLWFPRVAPAVPDAKGSLPYVWPTKCNECEKKCKDWFERLEKE